MIKMRCVILLVALCVGSCWGRRLTRQMQRHHSNSSALEDATTSPKYYGCFEGFKLEFQTTKLDPNNNNAVCQQFCKNGGYMFSATHKDVCGCFSKHPTKEVSGPPHGADTVQVKNKGEKCNIICPGNRGAGACTENGCCGGDLTYTVYQVGGVNKKLCSPALMKELAKKNVDLKKSNLPQCMEPAAIRDAAADLGIDVDASRLTPEGDCDIDYTKIPPPVACCSPACDWLLVYLCIDGTVMKCIDK